MDWREKGVDWRERNESEREGWIGEIWMGWNGRDGLERDGLNMRKKDESGRKGLI